MNKLSLEQRRAFAGFWAQLAVAWIAGGIIGPYLAGSQPYPIVKFAVVSSWTGVSLIFMLYLTQGGKK